MASDPDLDDRKARYEYRVWGSHKKARKLLAELASSRMTEEMDDCYFLGGEPDVNVKVRDETLKVKQLIERTKGFERWASARYSDVDDAPAPFDDLLDDLKQDREKRGAKFKLHKAVARIDAENDTDAVLVRKKRTRYDIGSMRAEVTDITIERTGKVLRTLAIEGNDLDELVALRKKLGLKGEENVAMHVAIDDR